MPVFGGTDGSEWKGFRGDGTSTTTASNLPATWSETEQILWRTKLEGFGQSSPVVRDGRIFITSLKQDAKASLATCAYKLSTGEMLWETDVIPGHTVKYSKMVARAAPTPAVDASGLYVFFGSGDLMKFSRVGTLMWDRQLVDDYGVFKGNHGLASSPLLHEGKLFLLIAHEGPSYVLAVDAGSGKTLWKADRPDVVSWSTPTLAKVEGKHQLVISSNGTVEGLDPETGKRIWHMDGIVKNTVASPSVDQDVVIAASSEASATTALQLGGAGDVGKTHVLWQGGAASSFGSPLIHEDAVYVTNRAGVISSLDRRTGELLWKHRAGASCWASPLAAGDRLYFFDKDGTTVVLKANRTEAQVVAENRLPVGKDDAVYGVAAVDGRLLIRTGSQLTCVGRE